MFIRCSSASVQFADGSYGIQDIDLEIDAGKITALIGPSGCGKTTLLRVVAGLTAPTAGSINRYSAIGDESLGASSPDLPSGGGVLIGAIPKGGVSFVFQQPVLLQWASAIQNVALPLELQGIGTRQSRLQAAEAGLADVGLADAASRLPSELSGGMQMRVSLARALITSPKLLLLDEPMAALDDMLRTQLDDLVLALWHKHAYTCLLVTHNIAEAIHLSHRLVVMRDGKIASEIDNPLPFPRSPDLRRTPEFADFYGHVSDQLRGEA